MTYPTGEIVTEHMDWLAFTVPFYKDLNWVEGVTLLWKPIPPIARFTNGQENAQGIRVYWNEHRPQMGKHCILSGSTLNTLGDVGLKVLEDVVSQSFKVTRLDLCVDLLHSNLNPRNATYHIIKGQVKTHAQKSPINQDAMVKGYTQYIGTKNSATFVRIYDKTSEMGVDFQWVRIEIQYGKRKTKSACEAYLQHKDIRGMVRNFVDFPRWRKWNALFNRPAIKVRYENKTTNTRKWLMDSVAKSVAKEMLLEDDQQFYLQFLQRIRDEYKILTQLTEEILW